jgi:DNA invertase Pin-like site-specific DNA recombinase
MLTRAALYARVSTEDAFERRTIEAQLHYLQQYTTLKDIPVSYDRREAPRCQGQREVYRRRVAVRV